VISKERARGSDRTFKILKKILQEEYKFRDSVKSCFNKMVDGPITYVTDPSVLKVVLHYFKTCLSERAGADFKTTHLNIFIHSLAKTSFVDLATLKASSRDHTKDISVSGENENMSRSEVYNVLIKENTDEAKKRPKVLEALIGIVKQYMSETGRHVRHFMQLIPWALRELEFKGYFDSDIFPKPQHGGEREIHVLEIKARLIQYGIELISKSFCSLFPSEVLTHPETKSRFVTDHYQETALKYPKYFVISKSADASKWCQRHHSSHFAAMLISITHKSLHNYIMRTLRLWSTKKINFPLPFVATLLKNEKTISGDQVFIRFRSDFYNASEVITKPLGNKMEIKSGMMQGILHYTSSLYHTMIHEVSRLIIIRTAQKLGTSITCTIVQGSDDSGMMLGVSGTISPKVLSRAYMLLKFKETFSQYLSVYWNECKSSIGTIDLIEFNSEWHLRHSIIKPTFRWISACMELSLTERFVDRYRMFYNVLSQCLEGGASTLECAVIQLCQCWLHYMMLGIYNTNLGEILSQFISDGTSPSLGFFPLDFDLSCAVSGFDFVLYTCYKSGVYTPESIIDESSQHFNFEGSDRIHMTRDLKSVKLRFGKMYLWQSLIDRLSLKSIEDALQIIEDDPLILFKKQYSWDDCMPMMVLKAFEPGVRESINNVSSLIRMMATSAFVLDRPCLTQYNDDGFPYQECLLKLLWEYSCHNHVNTLPVSSFFPLHAEYESFRSMILETTKSHIIYKQEFKKVSKVKLKVFTPNPTDHDIMGLCRKAWNLGGRVMLSSRQFNLIWQETKLQYEFLKDTLQETREFLGISTLELKILLENLTSKSRDITLMDTSGKQTNIENSLTRIYWPDVKVRSASEHGITECLRLRSFLFSLTTYWMTNSRLLDIAKRSIKSCSSLDKPYKDIPTKFRKLKTLYDWANNMNKIHLIDQIRSQKQSAIGFFSQTQKMKHGIPKGPGYWIGQVIGIPCHIEMIDDVVHNITLKYLSDAKTLGKSLSILLKEIKMSSGSSNVKSDLWLSKNGKIHSKYTEHSGSFPIKLEETIRADVITAMEDLPWSLQISNTTIRLVVTEVIDETSISYTILSESFSSRDWNPDLDINSPDLLLNFWNNNTPANMMEFEDSISSHIPDSYGDFKKFMKTINETPTLKGWDLSKFRSRALSQLTGKYKSISYEAESDMSLQVMEELDSFLDRIFTLTEKSIEKTLSWADDMTVIESIDHDIHIDITDETMNSIKSFAESIQEVNPGEDLPDEFLESWRQMPFSNRFFSNLEKLCMIQTGMTVESCLSSIKRDFKIRIDGTLGKVMSLLSSEFVYKGLSVVEESFDIISKSSRDLDTILSETEISNIDSHELQTTIDQLENVAKHLSGMAKTEVDVIISRKRRLLLLKASPTQVSDLEDLHYGEFMTRVLNHVFSNKLTKFHTYNVDIGLKLSLAKIELGEIVRSRLQNHIISLQEHTMMREYINRSIVSPYLIEILQECYGIKFNLKTALLTKLVEDIVIL